MTSALITLAVLATLALTYWQVRRFTDRQRVAKVNQCRVEFHRRREWLEAKFLDIASQRGSPRGLRWVDVDFDDQVSFARDRRNGELTALVAMSISFEAIEGGGMEDVEAVANLKAATGVFRYRGNQWTTEGRAIFNLNPVEAIEYYQSELEPVEPTSLN